MIGGLSMTELIIILGLALLLLGPDQLPALAKSLGKGLRELRKATDDIKSQFEQEIASVDMDESKPRRMIAPVPPLENDPAAARAGARTAASAAEDDPAAARAAARRAAQVAPAPAEPLALPAAPEGTVPARDAKA